MNKKISHNVHDGQLEEFSIGPRNELNLSIFLNPVWNRDGPERSRMRFGGIKNIEEVRSFFDFYEKKKRSGDFLDEIIGIVNEAKGIWIVDLADAGALSIESHRVTEL